MNGSLAGRNEDLARAVAGALAELGVNSLALVVESPSASAGWRRLEARSIDLPGELLQAIRGGGTARLYALDRPLQVTAGRDGWSWTCEDSEFATQMRAIAADSEGAGAG